MPTSLLPSLPSHVTFPLPVPTGSSHRAHQCVCTEGREEMQGYDNSPSAALVCMSERSQNVSTIANDNRYRARRCVQGIKMLDAVAKRHIICQTKVIGIGNKTQYSNCWVWKRRYLNLWGFPPHPWYINLNSLRYKVGTFKYYFAYLSIRVIFISYHANKSTKYFIYTK